eukprot:TRINITY_DN2265_c0_g1_i5.p1 TRINITY_DN2265_c0_g1~~TRINITY_DN2265_c0_g1_i5.p1  ORF type:complete len:326 (+),score=45.08 TRINITY_DN2265_c0_g1_i5:1108-2085(+)
MLICQVMFYVAWFITMVYLYSLGEIKPPIDGFPFGTMTFTQNQKGLLAFHLFGFFWINCFLIALIHFIIASAASIWYFAKDEAVYLIFTKSVMRAFYYHLGSLALGSLLLAIIQFIRFIIAYIHEQAKDEKLDNGPLRFLMCCIQCCIGCFERIVRFLNNHAYIQIALTGKNFCIAAIDAVYLIYRNALAFGIVTGLGNLYILLGKIFVCVSATVAGFLMITRSKQFEDKISSPVGLTICFAVVSYTVGALFMSVWAMASETILQCFFVDTELNNGDAPNCPSSLCEFVDDCRSKKKENVGDRVQKIKFSLYPFFALYTLSLIHI